MDDNIKKTSVEDSHTDDSNDEESHIEDDLESVNDVNDTGGTDNAIEVDDFSGVFSKKILDESSELEKATAVTNQLRSYCTTFCSVLLE